MKKRNLKKDLFKRGKKDKLNCSHCGACGGGIYFLGFIGAVIYYIQQSNSFWVGVLGVLKALIWPAVLIYKLLGFLS